MTTDTIDLTTLSDTQLIAHYKTTAPVEDVKFHIERCDHDVTLHRAFVELLTALESKGGKATPATRTEYRRLQQLTRERRNAADQAARERKPTSDANWNIYYRSAAGKLFASQGGKFIECAGTTCPAVVRPMPDSAPAKLRKGQRSKPVAPPVVAAPAVVAAPTTVETPAEHVIAAPFPPRHTGGLLPADLRTCVKCSTEQPIAAFKWGDAGRTTRHLCLACRKVQQREAIARRKQAA